MDLVVQVTRTGFEQFYVLTERPASDDLPELTLEVTAEGLAVTADAESGVAFTAPDGSSVASTSTPTAWDAQVDGERLHPITEPFQDNVPEDAVLSSGIAPPPIETVPSDQVGPVADSEPVPDLDDPAASTAPADAGQAEDEEASSSGGSTALPLPESLTGAAGSAVVYDLTPDAELLLDPATDYPVVVDPEVNAGEIFASFDTFVQHGFATDQSGSTELRLGTYNGGTNVARSFMNFDLSFLSTRIVHRADLWMWGAYAATCAAREWQVWETYPANTGTRINNQPGWVRQWSSSTLTAGYNGTCGSRWLNADVTSLIRMWADTGANGGTVGLKAGNETDNTAWKKFNSSGPAAVSRTSTSSTPTGRRQPRSAWRP
ncbi:DNRLRE domain-containing protein [Modestobacter sp. Leaf380]|uniref:DNRLRE domain-containing protein n=1 Tax=Modestobacter sp. Leaf380 TaxID=1736356 RepID=UPI00138F2385|nr:DNRLRE domain-containing protein [Modestobacter sp. Leaf380]